MIEMFIHEKALVDSKAVLGKNTSIWAFAVILADEGSIKIGKNSNIQEQCVIHGKEVEIGENVTIGHGAIVHGCKIGNNVLIGMNATILNEAEIGDYCIIGAGTVVTSKMKIPSNSLVLGVPGKIKRKLTEKDKELIENTCKEYLKKIEKIKK
ncbi:MAG: gamma carbonic anhydrase family protein [Candidatus Diapherotrites archaeon]